MSVVLSCQSLSKSYGPRPLFKGITFGIDSDEHLGLIGPNGSGKSTLLKLLCGLEKPDTGSISARKALRLGYVPQDENFAPEKTVGEVLEDSLTAAKVVASDTDIAITLNKVGFTDAYQLVGTLSGGWRKRLAIAAELVKDPELLMMDEPTNHLDVEGVLWLEKLLQNASFGYAVISHDRYFLENVTNRIVELNPSYADGYLSINGTYSDFLIKREEYLASQAHQELALATKVRREIEWLSRGAQARSTKAQGRIKEAGRLMDELAEVKFRNSQNSAVGLDFGSSGRQTRDLLVAKGVEKSLGGRTLFANLDLTLAPGMKLGLLGANGSGKTTLLRLMTGDLEPDAGTIKRAEKLRIVLFDQNRTQLDKTQTLQDALLAPDETVTYRGSTMHVSAWAKRFLFRTDQLKTPISYFSGGEQARILMARMMLQPADLLILDEPTNDLDIPSLEVLEETLVDFPGAIVLVTHDRYMLDQVSTEILALDGEGGAQYFADYPQWESYQARQAYTKVAPEKPAKAAAKSVAAAAPVVRMSTAERREWGQIEAKIEAAEQHVTDLENMLHDPIVASDHVKLQQCWTDLQTAKDDVIALYARWEELEAKQK